MPAGKTYTPDEFNAILAPPKTGAEYTVAEFNERFLDPNSRFNFLSVMPGEENVIEVPASERNRKRYAYRTMQVPDDSGGESIKLRVKGNTPEQRRTDRVRMALQSITGDDAVRRSERKGFLEALPFIGGVAGTVEPLKVRAAVDRIMDDPDKASQADYEQLAWLLFDEERRKQVEALGGGERFLWKVAEIAKALPGFAIEVAATSGVYSAGKAVGKRVIGKALRDQALRRIETRLLAGGVGAAAQTLANPQRIAEAAAKRTLPQVSIGDSGDVHVSLPDRDFMDALPAGFVDAFIEFASERAGGLIDNVPRPQWIRGLKEAAVRRWLAKNPDATMSQLLDKVRSRTGWHGVLGEVFEERVGDLARFEAGMQGADETIPELEDLAAEVVAFSLPGAARAALEWSSDRGPGDDIPLHPFRQDQSEGPGEAVKPEPAPASVPLLNQKELLLSEDGAIGFANIYPDQAGAIVDEYNEKGTVTARGPFAQVAARDSRQRWSAKERAEFAKLLEQAMADINTADMEGELEQATETTQPEDVPAESPVAPTPTVEPAPDDAQANEPAPVTETPAVEPEEVVSVPVTLATSVADKLNAGESLDDFDELAAAAYGGTRAEGAYQPSEAYDAMELGVNQHVRAQAGRYDPRRDADGAKDAVAGLEEVTAKLPRQRARSGEKDALQQFSTPPAYSYVAAWAANLTDQDVVLEPSAGTGDLAVMAQNAGARVYANELSDQRAALLGALGLDGVFTEDAEHVDKILPDRMPQPSVVLMNPPFLRAGKRMGGKRLIGTDLRHVDSALKLMAPGGRLVAIVGAPMRGEETKGFLRWERKASGSYDIRANVVVGRDVHKQYGTTFPTRLLVIDKPTGERAQGKTVTGTAATLAELIDKLKGVRDSRASEGGRAVRGERPGRDVAVGEQGGARGEGERVAKVQTAEAARRLQAAADAEPEEQGIYSGVPMPTARTPRRPDTVPVWRHSLPEAVLDRLEASEGAPRTPWYANVGEVATAAWHKLTRPYEYLPGDDFHSTAREVFRILRDVPYAVGDEVKRTIAAVIDPLGKNRLGLFRDKLLVRNMIAAVDRGEPLRHGFTDRAQLELWEADIDAAIEKTTDDDGRNRITEALDGRQKVVRELVTDLVDHDLLPEATLERTDDYWHQHVLNYIRVDRLSGANRLRPVKRSFQQRRATGPDVAEETWDYNVDYIEAEAHWMTEAAVELRKHKLLRQIAQKYDIKNDLKRTAFNRNYEAVVGGPDNMARVLELRSEIRAARDAGEDKSVIAPMVEELHTLDPTMPYRERIAWMSAQLRAQRPDAPGGELDDAIEESDIDARWFRFLKRMADSQDEELTQERMLARGIFSAITGRQQFVKERLGDQLTTWEDVLRERPDYAEWQPEPGNSFYKALTIPQRLQEAIEQGQLEELKLTLDQLRAVRVLGNRRPSFVLPVTIVRQLQAAEKPKSNNPVARFLNRAHSLMKSWYLHRPTGVVGYTLRNLFGDTDAVVGSMAAGMFTHAPRAWKELWGYARGNLWMSDDLRTARDLGVIGSAMTTVEVADLRELIPFQRFYDEKRNVGRMIFAPLQFGRAANEFRENLYRYMAFLHYKAQLAGGAVAHYGPSRKGTVDTLRRDMGDDVAAAHLARNLLGDYGNLTVFGEWMRKYAWSFWSFVEINFKRYPRMGINARNYAQMKGKDRAWARGVYLGLAGTAMSGVFAATYAFNSLVFPDEEEELNARERAAPHMILGRNSDGSIRVMRNMGSLGDFLDWFSIPELMRLAPLWRANQITTADLLKEMGGSTLTKFVGGTAPHIKAATETTLGLQMYPDVLNPRRAPRDEILANTLALRDEYLATKGLIKRDGTRARSGYANRILTGVSNPHRNAWSDTITLREAFLRQKNKASEGMYPRSAFHTLRQAIFNEDRNAFLEARRAYLKEKTHGDFIRALAYLDPIAPRLNVEDEREFETQFLTPDQRQIVRHAQDWAAQAQATAWMWWDEAGSSDAMWQAAKRKFLETQVKTLHRRPPRRQEGESAVEFRQRLQQYRSNRTRAARKVRLGKGKPGSS